MKAGQVQYHESKHPLNLFLPGPPMSVAQRISHDTERMTWNSNRERIQREGLTRDRNARDQDVRDRNVLHEVDEINRQLHQKNGQLQRENEELRQQLADQETQAVAALRQVADRSETWRRTMEHFRKAWGPLLPQVASDESSVCDVSDVKSQEVERDPNWQQQRDAFIQDNLKPAPKRTRKPRS